MTFCLIKTPWGRLVPTRWYKILRGPKKRTKTTHTHRIPSDPEQTTTAVGRLKRLHQHRRAARRRPAAGGLDGESECVCVCVLGTGGLWPKGIHKVHGPVTQRIKPPLSLWQHNSFYSGWRRRTCSGWTRRPSRLDQRRWHRVKC